MFTGIIESIGEIVSLEQEGENLHISIASEMASELKIDQSVSHNGVCLTVVAVEGNKYTVTAIKETLDKTNLGDLDNGSLVNLERAMILGARLDGHMVQGHVDQTGICTKVEEEKTSINNCIFETSLRGLPCKTPRSTLPVLTSTPASSLKAPMWD